MRVLILMAMSGFSENGTGLDPEYFFETADATAVTKRNSRAPYLIPQFIFSEKRTACIDVVCDKA